MKRTVSPAEIIEGRAMLAGFSVKELIKKTGIPQSTFYRKLAANTWTVDEFFYIDSFIHFTAEDFESFRRWIK